MKRRQVVSGIVVSIGFAVVLGVMLAMVAASQLTADIPAEMRATVFRTSFGGAVLSAGAIAVALCLSSPQRTALQNLLDLLPVSRRAARLGQLLPLLLVGFIYSMAISSTGIFILGRVAVTGLEAVLGISTYLLLIAVTLVVVVSVYTLLHSAAALARLPAQYCATIAGILALCGVLALTVPDIVALTPVSATSSPAVELPPHRAFAAAVGSPSPLRWTVVLGWVAAGVFLSWAAAVAYRPPGKPRHVGLLRRTRPLARSPFWACLWMETLVAVRSPQYVMVFVINPVVIAVVYMASLHPSTAILAPALAGSGTVLPFMLALYAVGRTTRFEWIGAMTTGRPATHVAPRAIAYFSAAAVVAVPTATIFVAAGSLPAPALIPTVLRWILATLVALVAGTLVPYSEQQQLSVAAGGFILAVGYLVASLGLSWLGGMIAPGSEVLLMLGAIGCFAGLYVMLSTKRRVPGAL